MILYDEVELSPANPSNFRKESDKWVEVKVWGKENVSASVHADTKWYCINVEYIILFFIITTISILLLSSQLSQVN
jgi:hypothetical protein